MTEALRELVHGIRMRYWTWRVRRLEARLVQEREDVALNRAFLHTERKERLAEHERLQAETEQAQIAAEFYRILIFNNDGPEVQ